MIPLLDVTFVESLRSFCENFVQQMLDKTSPYCVSGSTVINTMEFIRQNVLRGELGGFCSVATVLAGIICAGMMLKFSHDYLEGHGITLWELIRPLCIFVMIINFNSFVITPIHSICNIFTRSVERQCAVGWGQFWQTYYHVVQVSMVSAGLSMVNNIADSWKMDSELDQLNREVNEQYGGNVLAALMDDSFKERHPNKTFWNMCGDALKYVGKGLFGTLGGFVGGVGDILVSSVLHIIEGLLFVVMKIMLMCQQIYCYVYLIILGLIGPFAFAIGIVPAFRSTIPGWIARYIQVASWIPIGYIIMHINLEIMKFLTMFTTEYAVGGKYITFVAAIVSIMSISAVPKISAYIIESAGLNDAHGNVNAYLRSSSRAVKNTLPGRGISGSGGSSSSGGKAAAAKVALKAITKV